MVADVTLRTREHHTYFTCFFYIVRLTVCRLAGEILSTATSNLHNFFNVCANSRKLKVVLKNLTKRSFMRSVVFIDFDVVMATKF